MNIWLQFLLITGAFFWLLWVIYDHKTDVRTPQEKQADKEEMDIW